MKCRVAMRGLAHLHVGADAGPLGIGQILKVHAHGVRVLRAAGVGASGADPALLVGGRAIPGIRRFDHRVAIPGGAVPGVWCFDAGVVVPGGAVRLGHPAASITSISRTGRVAVTGRAVGRRGGNAVLALRAARADKRTGSRRPPEGSNYVAHPDSARVKHTQRLTGSPDIHWYGPR